MTAQHRAQHGPRTAAKFTLAAAGVAAASIAFAPLAQAAPDSDWDRLAQCESGGNWQINTGNGFYGGLQFTAQTWAGFGGHEFAPNAHQATREEQIYVAEKVLAKQGWNAWPACSRKLGLSSRPTNRPHPHSGAAPVQPSTPAHPAAPKDTRAELLNALNAELNSGKLEGYLRAGDVHGAIAYLNGVATQHGPSIQAELQKFLEENKGHLPIALAALV